jgi:hypothetical protein
MHDVVNRRLPATILILEYSFFLFQQGKWQESAKSFELAAAEYKTSGTPVAVQEAVKDFLHQDDGDDEKLCSMIMDIVLQNRMCGCHFFCRRTLFLLLLI